MPGGGRVERQLADRDAHAAGALVSKAEDPLVVGDDDEAHVAERPRARAAAAMRSMSSGVNHRPRGRRKMWLKSWQARPTVGV